MKNNDTGEFELVLGNRQLLSGFFIVVLLFGVAFAMGYIVGRNSTPSARLQVEASTGSTGVASKDTRPQPAPDAPRAASAPEQPVPQSAAAEATPTSQQAPAETATQPATQAATSAPARETPAAAPAPAEAPAAAPADAPPGSYWQVIATSNRTAAEALQQSLKDKGFPVTLGPGPNNLVRVLVGPYTDTPSMGRAKTQLEAAGLHPVRK
jgi:cell division septation protein DedD